jgi:hypothetical protein
MLPVRKKDTKTKRILVKQNLGLILKDVMVSFYSKKSIEKSCQFYNKQVLGLKYFFNILQVIV